MFQLVVAVINIDTSLERTKHTLPREAVEADAATCEVSHLEMYAMDLLHDHVAFADLDGGGVDILRENENGTMVWVAHCADEAAVRALAA